jgi:WD40 repeat protein
LSVSRDLTLRIWSKTEQRTIQSPHKNSIKCVSFDHINQHVCTGTYGGEFGIYDLEKNKWIHLERISESGISSVVFDPVNQRFLASTYAGKVHEIPAVHFRSFHKGPSV